MKPVLQSLLSSAYALKPAELQQLCYLLVEMHLKIPF